MLATGTMDALPMSLFMDQCMCLSDPECQLLNTAQLSCSPGNCHQMKESSLILVWQSTTNFCESMKSCFLESRWGQLFWSKSCFRTLERIQSMARFQPGFHGGSDGQESTRSEGDLGLIPGLGRSSGGEHGNPFQFSCLENPMDRGPLQATVHGVAKT